jgi:hypothetical protein
MDKNQALSDKAQLDKYLDDLWRWTTSLAYALDKYEKQIITPEELFKIISPIFKEVQVGIKERLEDFEQNEYHKLDRNILQELIHKSKSGRYEKYRRETIQENKYWLSEALWFIHDWINFIFHCQMFYNANHTHKEEIIFICVRFFKYLKVQIERHIKNIEKSKSVFIKKILKNHQYFFNQLRQFCKDIETLGRKGFLREIANVKTDDIFFQILIQEPSYIDKFIEMTQYTRISVGTNLLEYFQDMIEYDFERRY